MSSSMGFAEMDEGVKELLTIWVPGLAAFLSIILGLAPIRGVLQCRRRKSLGEVGHDPL